MGNESYKLALRSLRHVRRMAQELERLPEASLRVDVEDVGDAEYVTEWLHIVLCRICGQPDVPMPAYDAHAPAVEQFRWFIKKAVRQAKAIRRGLLLGRIEKGLFAKQAWKGLDTPESFLASFLSDNVKRRWWA